MYVDDTVQLMESPGPVLSYKLRYIVGFWLVEMAISTNQKPTIYRNLYENTGPEDLQTTLNTMNDYCSLFDLDINIDKTKVILFSRGKLREHHYFIVKLWIIKLFGIGF